MGNEQCGSSLVGLEHHPTRVNGAGSNPAFRSASIRYMKPALKVAVLTDTQAFLVLRGEWEDLYHDSPRSTPFQSWSWLYSWWESFGESYELRLITVRDGDLLVGLMPLMLENRWGFRRLLFIGKRGQLDLLAKKGWEDKVCEAGIRALRQMRSWHVIDLRDVSSTAAAWGIFQKWDGRQARTLADRYLFIEVKTWDEVLASLSRKHRGTVRRTLRRATDDNVRGMLARPEKAEQAAQRLVALHRELRQGRYINRKHLTPEFEAFIVAAARRLTNSGLGGIYEFWRDGEVIMSSLTIFGDQVTDAYLVGVNQEARQRYQWSSLGIYDALSMARNRNSAYLCLAQGQDSYKQAWPHEDVPYYRVALGRGPVSWSLYLMYLSMRAIVARHLKEHSTPKSIKNVAEWLKRRYI
jgi:CelD/BcsL family acetyltransferase involved in cellulose biosynthesis